MFSEQDTGVAFPGTALKSLEPMDQQSGEPPDGEQDPSPDGLPKRLRDARRAAGLSMEEAARRIGVSKSSIQRWEVGSNVPRDHWGQVEHVYGKTRLELEFGLSAEGDPPYPGWAQFLDWLDTVGERVKVEPWMIDNLRRLRVPDGRTISSDNYTAALRWLLALGIVIS